MDKGQSIVHGVLFWLDEVGIKSLSIHGMHNNCNNCINKK
jgi:hypothetical protein